MISTILQHVKKHFSVTLGCIITALTLTQCVTPNSVYGPQTHAAWREYMTASPFSNYSTGPSFPSRVSDIQRIPPGGVDRLVAAHLERVSRWMEDLPTFQARARAAAETARRETLHYKPLGEFGGEKIGEHTADEEAGALERFARGKAGEWMGGLIVELMAESSANGAYARVMRPYYEGQRQLVFDERALNGRLGHANSHSLQELCERLEGRRAMPRRASYGAPHIHISL